MKSWIYLSLLCLISYYLLSHYVYYLFLISLIYKILIDLHIIGEAKFNLGTIKKRIILYKTYKGSYKEVSTLFYKSIGILRKFNLFETYEYNAFSEYFDNQKETNEENFRFRSGIIINITENEFKPNQDLINYCINTEKWSIKERELEPAIVCKIKVIHFIARIFSAIRFNKDWERNNCDDNFIRKMKISKTQEIGVRRMEIWTPGVVEFYIPTNTKPEDLKDDLKEFKKE